MHLLHDVSDFVLFTVQDYASLFTDLQVLENRSISFHVVQAARLKQL